MGSLDRSLTIAFGAVVMALMTLFLVVASVLSFQIQDRRQGFLATALAHSVGESVNRVNFYQMRSLVRDLSSQVPGLGYLCVVDGEGVILAHTRAEWEGRLLVESGLPLGEHPDFVWEGQHFLQMTLPLRGGLNQNTVGTILVGVSIEDLRQDQARFLGTLIGFSLLGTLAAMVAVFFLSRRFGGRVQTLARQLQAILYRAPVGIAVLDAQGKFLQSSRSLASLVRSQGTFPDVVAQRLSAADSLRIKSQTESVRDTGTDAVGEWAIGAETWHITQFALDNGQTGLVAQDVSRRVSMEKDLVESRLQLDQIIEKSPVGISVTDTTTGRIIRANANLRETYGYSAERFQDLDTWMEAAYPNPAYRKGLRTAWYAATAENLKNGTPIPKREVLLTCADGTVRNVIVSTVMVGSLAVVTMVDRTEQKSAEQAIIDLNRSLEEKVRARTEELERTYRELVDSEKLAALGQLAAGMAHELNTPLAAIQAANRHNLQFMQGPFFPALDFLSSMEAEEVEFFIALAHRNHTLAEGLPPLVDRTKRRAMLERMEQRGWQEEEDLAEYLVELDYSEADLDRVNSRPRLRDVLQYSRQFLTVLRMNRVVAEGTEKASHVVDALRSYLTSGETAKFSRFSVSEQLETVLTLFQHKVRMGVEVSRELDHEAFVFGDHQRLNQVWMNLVHNALQAMNFQGQLSLRLRREGELVVVEVEDSGPGIPEAIRDRIFTPYFTTKKRGEGLGLGLDLCLKIVESHHGTVTFESRPGATVFRVNLPASAG